MDHIRQGRYSTPVKLHRRDELGVLAEGLQLMQSAVNTRDQSIRQLAYEDPLTGLMNRAAFLAALDEALADRANRAPLVVAVLNVERFRRINECLGYSLGDEVLKGIGSRLNAKPSLAAAVARLGGDQYAAFARLELPGNPQAWGAGLLERFKDPLLVQLQPIDISTRLGLAIAGEHANTAIELLRCADFALERARFAKRPMSLYDAAMKSVEPEQLSLLGDLQRAIEEDQLVLYFQPKISLQNQAVTGAEVLIRWQHPERGLLPPSAFIPFAEQTGFIRRITRWALDRACGQGAAWNRAGTPLPLAVNISAEDIGDELLDQRAAIDMGHSLGLAMVAEGIESEQSAARLREMACDYAQGFLYAKPMPRAELEKWLVGRERLAVSVAPRCFVVNDMGVLDATDIFKVPKHGF